MKVTVHSLKRPYAISHDVEFVPPYKMTEEAIKLDQSHIISDTAEEVDASTLDWRGRYHPPSG